MMFLFSILVVVATNNKQLSVVLSNWEYVCVSITAIDYKHDPHPHKCIYSAVIKGGSFRTFACNSMFVYLSSHIQLINFQCAFSD